MAAIVIPQPSGLSRRTHLVVLPGGAIAVLRQRLQANRRRLIFWRRRAVAGALALAVAWLFALMLVAGAGWASATWATATASEMATVAPAAAAVGAAPPAGVPALPVPAVAPVYVVQPGDTLWRVATALRPDSDPRAVVDVLAGRTHGAMLQPGQRIDVADLP